MLKGKTAKLSLLIIFVLLFSLLASSLVMAAGPGPSSFTSHKDYFSAELQGTSTNGHTEAQLIWVGEDGKLYIAVNSTHGLAWITVNGGSEVMPLYEYGELTPITVDGKSFDPKMELNGNTDDSRWTIFQLPLTTIAEGGVYKFYIKGQGGGHDVRNVNYTVQIPKVAANLTKYWIGGSSEPVVFNLYRTTDNPDSASATWKLVPSGEGGTVTLNPIPGSPSGSPAGTTYYAEYSWPTLSFADTNLKRYSYKVVEQDAGPGYKSTLISEDYNPTNRTYTFIVKNEYTIPIGNVTATKNWMGGSGKRPDLWFQLWRETGESEPEAVDIQKLPNNSDTVSVTFEDVELTDNDGNEYTFFVKEGSNDGGTFIESVPGSFIKTGNGLELTNTYQPDLTIEKLITGNFGDYSKTFTFNVTIDGKQHSFDLSHEGIKDFPNLSPNSEIKLSEESGSYKVIVRVNGGAPINPVDGVYTINLSGEDTTITVENNFEVVIDTGISLDSLPYIIILIIAVGGLGIMVIRKRKIRN